MRRVSLGAERDDYGPKARINRRGSQFAAHPSDPRTFVSLDETNDPTPRPSSPIGSTTSSEPHATSTPELR